MPSLGWVEDLEGFSMDCLPELLLNGAPRILHRGCVCDNRFKGQDHPRDVKRVVVGGLYSHVPWSCGQRPLGPGPPCVWWPRGKESTGLSGHHRWIFLGIKRPPVRPPIQVASAATRARPTNCPPSTWAVLLSRQPWRLIKEKINIAGDVIGHDTCCPLFLKL